MQPLSLSLHLERKIKSNDDHDDVDDDSDDESTFSFLIFVVKFGGKTTRKKTIIMTAILMMIVIVASTLASLIFIATFGEEGSQDVGDENSSRWRLEEACIFNLYCILRKMM